jgi:imidazolonepropionase-like amidohydrolase
VVTTSGISRVSSTSGELGVLGRAARIDDSQNASVLGGGALGSVPSMDDDDDRKTGGRYRMIPLVAKAVAMAVATKGLPIMIGSGADGGPYPHGVQAIEFEALVKRAGMSPARAIQSGTIVNATAMGWQDRIGSIERGKYADIIAVAGDPLADITELQRVKFVMKGGRIVRDDLAWTAAAKR